MNLLAIETSTESCSAALLCGAELLERSQWAPRQHAERLLPMLDELLAEAGLARQALDALAVGRGPGAFTGVRLSIALTQGLALGLDRPVVPVSSLAALALEAPANGAAVLAVIDARMGEIYAATYQRQADGGLLALSEEQVLAPAQLRLPSQPAWNVVGSGWSAYAAVLSECLPAAPCWAEGERYPQARHVASLALPLLRAGAGVPADAALPVYLRDKVAQTLAERGQV